MRLVSLLAGLLLAGCVTAEVAPPEIVRDLAPTGTLRAAVGDDGVSGALARELGKRLGVPVSFVGRGEPWDIAFRRQESDYAAATPPGHPLGERYLGEFLDEMKASGFIDAALKRTR